MNKTETLPARIYTDVLEQIHGVISALYQDTSEDRLSGEQNTARDVLQNVEQKLRLLIEELQQNAEWGTFTIAFYGETNAGKSTLIECLRILLKEQSKLQERQEFRILQKQLGIYGGDLEKLEQQAETLQQQQTELEEQIAASEQQYTEQTASLAQKTEVLHQRLKERKNNTHSSVSRFLTLLRKFPEEMALQRLQQQAERLLPRHAAAVKRLRSQQQEAQSRQQQLLQMRKNAMTNGSPLAAFEDGVIIGDGRSDFTREMHHYTFEVEGRSFTILDVPGIEGSEADVNEHIQCAVQSAHAVFYVTSKAAPPQEGDDGRQGTLEKIKSHLGAQTEVWTLFNKRITNPLALTKATLISKDEQEGLAALDQKMREKLGRHYRRSMALSALPAFLAVAEYLTPASFKAVNRKKFLNAMTKEQILTASGVEGLQQHLMKEVLRGNDQKIKRSNLNKVSVAIDNVCQVLEQLRTEQFQPLADDLYKEAQSAERQLEMAKDGLRKGINEIGRRAIVKFGARVRQQVYVHIDNDIDNDDFETVLRDIMEKEQYTIQENLPDLFNQKVNQFQKHAIEIVERFKEHSTDVLEGYERINLAKVSNQFSIDVNLNSGVQLYGLITSFAGGALMLWNPVGWVVMSIGAITLLTGLFKSIWGFFSDEYRKNQQRRAAEKNIRKAYHALSISFQKRQSEALLPLVQKIEEIKALLWVPVAQAEQVCTSLDAAHQRLTDISGRIKQEGRKR